MSEVYLNIYRMYFHDQHFEERYADFLSDEDFDNIAINKIYGRQDVYWANLKNFDGTFDKSYKEYSALQGNFFKLSDLPAIFVNFDEDGLFCTKHFFSGRMRWEELMIEGGSLIKNYGEHGGAGLSAMSYFNYKEELHNERGFAYICYDEFGKVKYGDYYLNDDNLSKEEWEKKMIVKLYW